MSLNERSWHAQAIDRRAQLPAVVLTLVFIMLAGYISFGVIAPTVVTGTPPAPGIGTVNYVPNSAEAAFVRQADHLCARVVLQSSGAMDKLSAADVQSHGLKATVPVLDKLLDYEKTFIRDFSALLVPRSLKAPVGYFLDLVKQSYTHNKQLRAAAVADDVDTFLALADAEPPSGAENPVNQAALAAGLTGCSGS